MDELYIQPRNRLYPALTLPPQTGRATARDTGMEFEWDEAKRLKVLEKHGIDFLDLDELFDRDVLFLPARSDGEARELAVGWSGTMWVTVVFTRRGEKLRLITARRARENERRAYRAVFH